MNQITKLKEDIIEGISIAKKELKSDINDLGSNVDKLFESISTILDKYRNEISNDFKEYIDADRKNQ